MNEANICKTLEFIDSDLSSELDEFDNDILDPDFIIPGNEENELGGILAFDSDNNDEDEVEQQQTVLGPEVIEQCGDESEQLIVVGPEVIQQSSEEENMSSTSTYTGRKRKRKPNNWKRNALRNKRALGEQYISYQNKVIPPRVTGADCMCTKQCFINVSDDDKIDLLSIFNSIGDKSKQDTLLSGLIRVNEVSRHRSRDGSRSQKSCSVKYSIRVGIKVIEVCKKAFCSLHGIDKSRVERVVQKIKNKVPSPTDNRGRHSNRPNKLPASIRFQIDTHINSIPKRLSHYSRSDNGNTKYMSSDLSIAKLYRLYLKKYEPDFWAVYNSENQCQIKPILKYAYFHQYFVTNFNISFAHPRTDTCQTCDKFKNIFENETNNEEIATLKLEKEIHLRKAEIFYKNLRELSLVAKENNDIDVLSMDYQRNMPLPHITSGDVFYKRQLWCFNFCIHSAKSGKSHFFMYNETISRKGPNEVISFLHYYIKNLLNQNVKKLYLFSDNCCAQNKNKNLLQYLSSVINSKDFKLETIIHQYPEPGHSFLPCDRYFAHIEKAKKKLETVFLPDEYEKLVNETNKKFNVIHVTQEMIFNFSDYLTPLCKKIISNKDRTKFTIMAYRYIEYTADGLFCSISGNSTAKEKFSLVKPGLKLEINENDLHVLYNSPIKLKIAKFNDVTQLASKYVPEQYQWFYSGLLSEDNNTKENIDCDSDYEQ